MVHGWESGKITELIYVGKNTMATRIYLTNSPVFRVGSHALWNNYLVLQKPAMQTMANQIPDHNPSLAHNPRAASQVLQLQFPVKSSIIPMSGSYPTMFRGYTYSPECFRILSVGNIAIWIH